MARNSVALRLANMAIVCLALAASPARAQIDANRLLDLGIEMLRNAPQAQPPAAQPQRQTAPRAERQQNRPQRAAPAVNPQVLEVQERLAELGYDPGPADGLYGRRTRTAIEAFQRDRGLAVTGRVEAGLISALAAPPPPATGRMAAGTQQPSFDCARATTASEVAICADPSLAALDRAIAEAYTAARAGDDAAATATAQRAWLDARDACMAEGACLAATMRSRLLALSAPRERASPLEAAVAAATAAADAPAAEPITMPSGMRSIAPLRAGDRLLTGFPIIHGPLARESVQIDRGYFSKPSLDLALYVDLMIAKAQPRVLDDETVALEYARRYLTGEMRERYYVGCTSSCSRNVPYSGWRGDNEFAREASYRGFVAEVGPQLAAAAPDGPLDVLHITEAELLPYDDARQAFPLHPRRPGMSLFGTAGSAADAMTEIEGELPTEVAIPREEAPAFIERLSGPQRIVYIATEQSVELAGTHPVVDRPLLVLRNESSALYADPEARQQLHDLEPVQPAAEAEAPAAPPPGEVMAPVSEAVLVMHLDPEAIPREPLLRAVKGQIAHDQTVHSSTMGNAETLFAREEVQGRHPDFLAEEILDTFLARVAEGLAPIGRRLVVTETVPLDRLVYRDGAIRARQAGAGAEPRPMIDPLYPDDNATRLFPDMEGELVHFPHRVHASMPAGGVPEALQPTLQRLGIGQAFLALDRRPAIPPLEMDAAAAEQLWIPPSTACRNADSYRAPQTAEEAREKEECDARLNAYDPNLKLEIDLDVGELARNQGAYAIATRVLGARLIGPTGEVMHRYAPEELGLPSAPEPEAPAEPESVHTQLAAAPASALVVAAARQAGQDPVQIFSDVISWRQHRELSAFEIRDRAEGLARAGAESADGAEFWVAGTLRFADYDFATEAFPARELALAPLPGSMDADIPENSVRIGSVDAGAFALAMPPERARVWQEAQSRAAAADGGDPVALERISFPIRVRVQPLRTGMSSGSVYVHADLVAAELLAPGASPAELDPERILHRYGDAPGARTEAEPVAAAAEAELAAQAAPSGTGYDVAGVSLGMTLAEVEAVIGTLFEPGWTADLAPEAAAGPYRGQRVHVSADRGQLVVLGLDPGDDQRVSTVIRKLRVPGSASGEALRASLVEKYGEPAWERDSLMAWTEHLGQSRFGDMQMPPYERYATGNCAAALRQGAGLRDGTFLTGSYDDALRADGSAAARLPAVVATGGTGPESWATCGPVVLAETGRSQREGWLVYALFDLSVHARAAPEASEPQAVLPDL